MTNNIPAFLTGVVAAVFFLMIVGFFYEAGQHRSTQEIAKQCETVNNFLLGEKIFMCQRVR